jgi:hypothetical protein
MHKLVDSRLPDTEPVSDIPPEVLEAAGDALFNAYGMEHLSPNSAERYAEVVLRAALETQWIRISRKRNLSRSV